MTCTCPTVRELVRRAIVNGTGGGPGGTGGMIVP